MNASTSSVAFLVVCLSGCLLYTNPVNGRPSVRITAPVGSVAFTRAQTVAIGATASDPDGDRLQFAWYVVAGACAATPDLSDGALASTADPPFKLQLPADVTSAVCVSVQVTDRYGAKSDPDQITVSVVDREPAATIDVQGPTPNAFGRYDLYSSFRLGAGRSTDPDGDPIATRLWTLRSFPPGANNPTPMLTPCSPTSPEDLVVCFDAGSFPGDYDVELVVNDGLRDSPPAELRLTVDPDHPPCVSGTDPAPDASPLVLDPAQPKTFSVTSVIDDGAPYPAPTAGAQHVLPSFAWSLRRNGGAFTDVVGYQSLASVTLAAGSFVTGDRVDVRVVVSDGAATHPQGMCDPRCPAGCPDTVTWMVEYR